MITPNFSAIRLSAFSVGSARDHRDRRERPFFYLAWR